MSHFYGTLKGARGEASRCGTKTSGIRTVAASWAGAIEVTVYQDDHGKDCFRVEQMSWHGHGIRETIAEGFIGEPAHRLGKSGEVLS